MKTTNPKTITIVVLCAILSSFVSCKHNPDKPGFWVDGKIDADISSPIHDLNKEFLSEAKDRNMKKINYLISKELEESAGKTVRDVDHIRNALNKYDYDLFKEVYVVNKWKDADTVSLADGKNNFTLKYPSTAKEMYFAMFLPKTGDNKKMITLIYSKLDYGWKITKMEIDHYTENGKTAPEFYKVAQDDEANKYYADAVTTIGMGIGCIKPNQEWEYTCEKDFMAYYDKLVAEANKKFKFPMFINNVGGPVAIFRIYDQRDDDGIFPTICYLTKINVKDAAAVQQENLKIQKVIGTTVPGIDKNKKILYYSAYNKIPIDAYQDHYDMTQKLQ